MSVKNPMRSRHVHSTLPRVGMVALLLLVVGLAVTQKHAAAGAQATASAPQTIQSLVLVGTSTVHGTPIGSGAVANPEFAIEGDFGEGGVKGGASAQVAAAPAATSATARGHHRFNRPIPSKEAARRSSLVANAASANTSAAFPPPEPVVASDFVVPFQSLGFQGFSGISHIDSRTANNGNQFSVEPPDQGLCVGNGYVFETVNDAVRVFDTQGNPLTGVEDMASFFGQPAAIDRTTGVFGPELSDPKCFFDQPTRRWFVSELMVDNGTNPGATGRSFNLLAVSQTDHPTGAFTIFMYDVTDDGLNGTPNHPGCPCLGDQPLLGADKFGVYQSTNEFGDSFNGSQIYAISKQQIEAAAASPTAPLPVIVHFDASQQLVPFGGLSYSVQPATAPTSDDWDHDGGSSSKNGVEYFLSALQFVDTFDNRIAVWAITNTKSLSKKTPTLTLSFAVLRSETYGQPNPATQKVGEIPLGVAAGDPEETINTNDDRMNQVVFANGVLYGGVNSLLKVGGAEQQGIAWFGVNPRFDGPTLTGRVVSQGYVAVAGADVYFPSIGVNDDGNGVIAFSLSGAKYFPSAAYVDMIDGHDLPFVHISGAGKDPEDGFSGYPDLGGDPDGVARWGDYSAAIADGNHVWFAAEYIPKACSSLTPTTPLCRTVNANWGTFVSAVRVF
jgi:hypothetical protein